MGGWVGCMVLCRLLRQECPLLGLVGAAGRCMDADWSPLLSCMKKQLELVWCGCNDDKSSCHKLYTVTNTRLQLIYACYLTQIVFVLYTL